MLNERNVAVEPGDPRDEVIRQQAEQIRLLEVELVRLKELLATKADAKAAKKPTFTDNYSLDRNKQRKANQKKPRHKRGRKLRQAKLQRATQQLDVYPDGAERKECVRVRSQFAGRIVDGKAIYVCYHIHDRPSRRCRPDCETAAASSASKSF